MGKAINYLFTYWDTLIKYPKCFEATPDNNLAENSIRPFTLGRKNWLFSVSQQGAEASALYYSLVETAKVNNINVYKYLNYILEKAPVMKQESDWEQLLPWNVSKNDLQNLENRSTLATPDETRVEKYIFRGAH
ncbi:MAG: transposase [Spirochaetia bacterium]|nr:transposase [Spirochaetia bacterium]